MTFQTGKFASQREILQALPASINDAFYRVTFCPSGPSVVRKHLRELLHAGAVEVVERVNGRRRIFAPTELGCKQFSLPKPGPRPAPESAAQVLTSCWMAGFRRTVDFQQLKENDD